MKIKKNSYKVSFFFFFSFSIPLLPSLLLTKGTEVPFESDLNHGGCKGFGAETMEYVILLNGAISYNLFTMAFYS